MPVDMARGLCAAPAGEMQHMAIIAIIDPVKLRQIEGLYPEKHIHVAQFVAADLDPKGPDIKAKTHRTGTQTRKREQVNHRRAAFGQQITEQEGPKDRKAQTKADLDLEDKRLALAQRFRAPVP